MDTSTKYENHNSPSQQHPSRRTLSGSQAPGSGHTQSNCNTGLPATPRMLRNVSGSQKSSTIEIFQQQQSQPSAQNTHEYRNDEHQKQTSPIISTTAQSNNINMLPSPVPRRMVTSSSSKHSYGQQSQDMSQSQLQRNSPTSPKSPELLPPANFPLSMGKESPIEGSPAHTSVHISPQQYQQKEGNPQTSQNHSQHHSQHPQQQQQFHRKSIGDWDFVKTIGAGSMGKVKLAQHNSTGEICAVKIVPRAAKLYQRAHANDPPPLNAQAAAQRSKEIEKEFARDKRTIREGALGRLLFHPYICRLYEMVPMTNHYYMLFEYVEGGQMLDYIVSHGSLKERNARKFARGIASALDYCHKNNVVHRDLKIENIMINQKGDIKIIDFGLSNLYSPKSLLKTYCGSLYFAAPELLSAKPYLGPEVDVWSFGVVLYVLVCGKVPFDDQSVSILHEKIKRGNVDYPTFLSKECVSLLSRMLVVDPSKRAKLYEVIQHPWMNKVYDSPLQSYVPRRVPLTLPLDAEIIKTIAAFDLGSINSIIEELTSILSSVEYQMSSENWYKVMERGKDYAASSNSNILPDPTCGFHPLVSIYYLVDEMKKRKRAKEEAVKAQIEQQAEQKQKDRQAILMQQQTPQTPTQAEISGNQHKTLGQTQQIASPLSFPPQAHTSSSPSTYKNSKSQPLSEAIEPVIPEQQPQSPRESSPLPETLDPGSKSTGFNSILRKLSTKKSKNPQSPIKGNTTSPSSSEQSMIPPNLPKLSITSDSKEKLSPQSSQNKRDPMVRRGVSMKVTAKEKSSSSRTDLLSSTNDKVQSPARHQNALKPILKQGDKKKSHGRSTSVSSNQNKLHGFVPVEYLPPLPNINTDTNTLVSPSTQIDRLEPGNKERMKMHPTARAKSVGGHVRRESYSKYRSHNSHNHPLPNSMMAQNSDELIPGSTENDGFFDDVTLDDVEYQEIPQLTEDQIIEQFNNSKPNSMPSIEYPKTLFLKGFFSVQTTSTKPLPVIRYNLINVLSQLGVRFQEVKGGFVCAHTPSLQVTASAEDGSSNNNTMISDRDNADENSEERKLYGDAFKSTSSSIEKIDHPPRIRTPEPEYNEHIKTPSRQASLNLNSQMLSPSSNSSGKSHRSSNSFGGGHRRKFSLGNSILGSYRGKKNGSQVHMPPNTPATARVGKLLYPDEEEDLYHEGKNTQNGEDDSVDSLNGMMVGGSDMLVSSRLEHRVKHQHTTSTSGHIQMKKSPLKFEIHIVKVPLVGLYGVQFKKLLGNTWNYKTLAGQILKELNL